ncbi:hypothetical protein EES42_24965 [Streptomyces sp. ADI95-17]|nr:hypothetical protein EES42_24965 [Streptomyces sp. ADI95-17]
MRSSTPAAASASGVNNRAFSGLRHTKTHASDVWSPAG